jgi:hypothetical protein
VALLHGEGYRIEDLISHRGSAVVTVPAKHARGAERALGEHALTCEVAAALEEYSVRFRMDDRAQAVDRLLDEIVQRRVEPVGLALNGDTVRCQVRPQDAHRLAAAIQSATATAER